MKATYIPTLPPKSTREPASEPRQVSGQGQGPGQVPEGNQQRIALEPEVLAACLARYSRTNEGIGSILEKYGDKSPTAIFKFIDYGHASIGGLTGGIAIAIDDVSMLAALKLFELSQMSDGQESSTRYIELNPRGILNSEEIGISDPNLANLLSEAIKLGFELYNQCLALLEERVSAEPFIARIPPNTPEKTAQRMLKNYGLDRCRYFLPMCAKTNLALVMSARCWAQTLKELESLPWKETQELSKLIRQELYLAAPDLIRHSHPDTASLRQTELKIKKSQILAELEIEEITKNGISEDKNLSYKLSSNSPCHCNVRLYGLSLPNWEAKLDLHKELRNSFEGKENRYSSCGDMIKRMTINCSWSAMALAEIRDLNRHRTGFRSYHSIPKGFFLPHEISTLQKIYPEVDKKVREFQKIYDTLIENVILSPTDSKLKDYFYFLGTQVPFEHCQQLDKFIYEAELRTGLGAHFKYAEHLNNAASELIKLLPEVKDFIKIGTAEPE
jgi:thymidylate synthase ThyX